ncbi:BQ5605_C012g06941 [Microbotryum silenes-dioicae]|uniref:BQ5605_C012g06941 protein n=1 Tax=Microbotryum silenes-dioicae TaxID=796604 RepID=A0A2X0NWP3_9BASI|nr:BQ5605_C012g06941 [Microbotryum silenes-dioicae]
MVRVEQVTWLQVRFRLGRPRACPYGSRRWSCPRRTVGIRFEARTPISSKISKNKWGERLQSRHIKHRGELLLLREGFCLALLAVQYCRNETASDRVRMREADRQTLPKSAERVLNESPQTRG